MNVKENIEEQIQELEMLESMFPDKDEIYWHDPTLLIDARSFVAGEITEEDLRFLTFEINLCISGETENFKLKISVGFSDCYPSDKAPDVSVSSDNLCRNAQTELNCKLGEFLKSLPSSELMMLEIVSWLQENSLHYFTLNNSSAPNTLNLPRGDEKIIFMALYMHHIYNKEKRKNIIKWAGELQLKGFSLPGKPGVVYIQGFKTNVDEYFERLRRLTWKRMSCKIRDDVRDGEKFTDFTELSFGTPQNRDYHMDMGQFFEYLQTNGLAFLFKVLFGLDGHNQS